MNIYELLKFRERLFEEISDGNSLSENDFIEYALNILFDSKLIDNKSINESFLNSFIEYRGNKSYFKVNSYMINETGERLQLFVVDENGLFASSEENILQSTLEYYNDLFKLCENFSNFAFNKRLVNLADSGQINALVNYLTSVDGVHAIDTIDIFLISPTITYQKQGGGDKLKDFDFKDAKISMRYALPKKGYKNEFEEYKKDIVIYKHLINLNYLYKNYLVAGNNTPLIVNFEELGFPSIQLVQGAVEEKFESYIGVLPAKLLVNLYKKYSFRLLEKNVRSFLQFKGPNKGMRETLQKEPEKFIAYNNGLTITATGKGVNEKGYINSLTDFQIVNGGQTTASIYFSAKDRIDVSKVSVLAKINIAKNTSDEELEDLISNISKYSNSQSKVSSVDLRSRNAQLGKIKIQSEGVLTPSGKKWFFEKSRGELNTMMRFESNKREFEKKYPKDKRLSKELLGKYYSSWGDRPYLVKKGGEAIFRIFIEDIEKKEINRNFYEDLIGRVLLFRGLEDIHGVRNNAISQIRSAIIPYTMSVVYEFTDKTKGDDFSFFKIWKDEGLTPKAKDYFLELMLLVLQTVKKCATSDDLGEHSKKEELWNKVIADKEIQFFMKSDNTKNILSDYAIKKSDKKKLLSKKKNERTIDFEPLLKTAMLYDKGEDFYRKIQSIFYDTLSDSDNYKLDNIRAAVKSIKYNDFISLNFKTVEDFDKIREKIIQIQPKEFDDLYEQYSGNSFVQNVEWIIKKYNEALDKEIEFYEYFKNISDIAQSKGVKFTSNFKEISDSLEKGESPTIKQTYFISFYLEALK